MATTAQEKTKRLGILFSSFFSGFLFGILLTAIVVIGYVNSLSPQQAIMAGSIPTSFIWVLVILAIIAASVLVYQISTLFR